MPKAPKYQEKDILLAIQDVENGVSKAAAALKHGVPRSTLRDRLNGAGTRHDAHAAQMKLSPHLEASLAEWCRVQDALGLPPSHNIVRLVAERMLQTEGCDIQLSKRWIDGFLRRNPVTKSKKGQRLKKARAKAVTPNKIRALFQILNKPLLKSILP